MTTVSAPATAHRTFLYKTSSEWLGRRNGRAEAADAPPLAVSSPTEFRGEAGRWSPEAMFVSSIESCLMLTFASLAEKHHLPVEGYYSEATGTLEHSDGRFRFTRIAIRPTVVITDRALAEKTLATMREAMRSCIVSNSIGAQVDVLPDIELSACE